MRPFTLAAALAAAHVVLGLVTLDRRALGVDRTAFDLVEDVRTPGGVDAVRVLTDLGALPVAAIAVTLGALVANRQGRPVAGLALIIGFLLTVALVYVTKALWDRPRPADRLAGVSSPAYPSGHAAQGAAWLAAAHVTHSRPAIVAAAVLVAAIGLSRLYLNVHYLTDVLGGFALAGAVFAVLLRRA